jgi:hypothetical protein
MLTGQEASRSSSGNPGGRNEADACATRLSCSGFYLMCSTAIHQETPKTTIMK